MAGPQVPQIVAEGAEQPEREDLLRVERTAIWHQEAVKRELKAYLQGGQRADHTGV